MSGEWVGLVLLGIAYAAGSALVIFLAVAPAIDPLITGLPTFWDGFVALFRRKRRTKASDPKPRSEP